MEWGLLVKGGGDTRSGSVQLPRSQRVGGPPGNRCTAPRPQAARLQKRSSTVLGLEPPGAQHPASHLPTHTPQFWGPEPPGAWHLGTAAGGRPAVGAPGRAPRPEEGDQLPLSPFACWSVCCPEAARSCTPHWLGLRAGGAPVGCQQPAAAPALQVLPTVCLCAPRGLPPSSQPLTIPSLPLVPGPGLPSPPAGLSAPPPPPHSLCRSSRTHEDNSLCSVLSVRKHSCFCFPDGLQGSCSGGLDPAVTTWQGLGQPAADTWSEREIDPHAAARPDFWGHSFRQHKPDYPDAHRSLEVTWSSRWPLWGGLSHSAGGRRTTPGASYSLAIFQMPQSLSNCCCM